jgi:hypothetical protein
MAAEDAAPRARSLSGDADAVPAVASGSPFSVLDRLRSGSGSASSGSSKKARRPKKKKRRGSSKTELTPLLLAKPEEEVHPLPWFRSPEWTRRSPVRLDARRGRRRGVTGDERPAAAASWWRCCFPCGADAGNGADTESDVELGLALAPPKDADAGASDADGFKQCIQFLVGLIVLVAVALILLIIFQPRALPPPPHGP